MSKSKWVNLPRSIRVDEEVHEHLNTMAERERRSVTNLIGIIIEDAVKVDKIKIGSTRASGGTPKDYAE